MSSGRVKLLIAGMEFRNQRRNLSRDKELKQSATADFHFNYCMASAVNF
jgi:hypothetical protein